MIEKIPQEVRGELRDFDAYGFSDTLIEATLDDFYERLDRACSENSGTAQLLRERPENLHDYQGCANDPKMQPLDKEKSCCTVCDARKKCHVCGQQTLYACSDCRIDFGVTVYVCNKKECRDAHEQKCPAALLRTIAQLQGLNVAQSKIILGMQKRNDSLQQVDSFYQQHQVDTEKISELGKLVDDACTKGEEVCRQRDDLQQQLAQIREVKGERP
jgi:hypothetical protein